MNTQFTPGPWYIAKGRSKNGGKVRINGVGWGHFAKVCVRMLGDSEDCTEGVANSRLIAAAPDLYKMCADTLALLEPLTDNPASAVFMESLRAALSKATLSV